MSLHTLYAAVGTAAFALVFSIAPAASLAHGGEDHSHPAAPPPAAAPATLSAPDSGQPPLLEPASRLPDGSLFVPKSVQRQLGIRTALAEAGKFPQVVELNGRVMADPNAGGRVQAMPGGRIEAGPQGLAVLGQKVRKGDVLAWLQPAANAIDRGSQQSALDGLVAQETTLARRLDRLRQLEGSVPQREIEQAQIELESLHKRKAAVGGSLQREALRAPVSGVVSAANAVAGQVVEPREIVFEIVDPQRLSVEALAFDPALLEGIAGATAALPGVAGTTSAGAAALDLAIVGVGRSLREQAMPVLFRVVPPKTGALPMVAVGQTVKVLARTSTLTAGVAVPSAAVVRNGVNETVVWVHDGAERFVARKVRSAALDSQRSVATEGLSGGERVVTLGAAALGQIR